MTRSTSFYAVMLLGGLVFGFGLGYSEMAKPEVVLSFLQLQDFGLLFVMFGAAIVAGLTFEYSTRSGKTAPLTGDRFGKRLKSMDNHVLLGGVLFGAGWGLSGICPGAAYASLGIGNYPILVAVLGMFIGAYVQDILRQTTLTQIIPWR